MKSSDSIWLLGQVAMSVPHSGPWKKVGNEPWSKSSARTIDIIFTISIAIVLGVKITTSSIIEFQGETDSCRFSEIQVRVYNFPSSDVGAHSDPHLDFGELMLDCFALKF